jgi:hypothetical protein
MVQVIQATKLELYEVKQQFQLEAVRDLQFFSEWQEELPEISDFEKQILDKVKDNFLSISEFPLSEEVVKITVLGQLLFLSGLTEFPLMPSTEKTVEIEIENEEDEAVIRGKIDLLLLYQNLWAIVIESKWHKLSVHAGLAQALLYMMSSPNGEKPTFGMVLNGLDIIFIKLVKQDSPQYGLSRLFSLLNPDNDLYEALGVLKKLKEIVIQ